MTDDVDRVLCARIRHYRQRRGLTIKALAERCAELGAPDLTVSALTNIERGPDSGRRPKRVAVQEWLVLAYALRVPPLAILIPLGSDQPFAITDNIALHPLLALDALSDNGPLPDGEGRIVGAPGEWNLGITPIDLYRRFMQRRDALEAAWADHQQGSKDRHGRRLHEAITEFGQIIGGLLDADLPVPASADDWFYRLFVDDEWSEVLTGSLNRAGKQWMTDWVNRREGGEDR